MQSLFGPPNKDQPILALALLLSGVFVLALQDALIKEVSVQTSYWQFQVLRASGNLTLAVIFALLGGGLSLIRPRRAGAVYLRAFLMTLCMFCFFSGAPYLSLTQMAAGLYTYPLFVSLLAGPVLGEHLGRWRLFALVLGIAGAALFLSPWEDGFRLLQALPILAGFFFATNVLTIRRACRGENTLAMAFAVAVAFLLSGLLGTITLSLFPLSDQLQVRAPFVTVGWPLLTWAVAGIAAITALLNLIGNICLSRAYQTADASWLVPVDFSYLLFAAFWGLTIFGTWPSNTALAGMVLIGGAGALTAWREGIKQQARDTI